MLLCCFENFYRCVEVRLYLIVSIIIFSVSSLTAKERVGRLFKAKTKNDDHLFKGTRRILILNLFNKSGSVVLSLFIFFKIIFRTLSFDASYIKIFHYMITTFLEYICVSLLKIITHKKIYQRSILGFTVSHDKIILQRRRIGIAKQSS